MKDVKNEEDSDAARDRDRKDRRDRKRKRSSSPQERYRSPPPVKPDDEPEIDDETVLLSWCKLRKLKNLSFRLTHLFI